MFASSQIRLSLSSKWISLETALASKAQKGRRSGEHSSLVATKPFRRLIRNVLGHVGQKQQLGPDQNFPNRLHSDEIPRSELSPLMDDVSGQTA